MDNQKGLWPHSNQFTVNSLSVYCPLYIIYRIAGNFDGGNFDGFDA